MRAVQRIGDSFLDFVENTSLGSNAFRLARLAFFGMIILVASKVGAAQTLGYHFEDVLFMAITGVLFLVVFLRWEVGIVLTLCTTSFIAYYSFFPTLSLYHFIPEIPILEHLRLNLGQGLMLFLLALFATSPEVKSLRKRLATPLAPAVLMFMVAILIAAVYGVVFKDVHLRTMSQVSRPYSYYLMFFVTLLCVRGRKELNLVLVCAYVMSVTVAILMFVQFLVGSHVKVFPGGSIRIESFGNFAGRILPPGVALVWFAVPFVIARVSFLKGNVKRITLLSLGVLLGGLLLTFTRAVWMGTLVGMILMAMMGRGKIRAGIFRMWIAMAGFVLVLLMILSLASSGREDYVTPYINRFTSVFKLESYEEGGTAFERWKEVQAAWPKIVENPILGIGVGGIYRWVDAWDDIGKQHYLEGVTYIHNAYILILTNAGALGLGTCLLAYILFFVRGTIILGRLKSLEDRALVIAAFATIVSVLIASMMQPSLWQPGVVPLIGIVFGMVELLRYLSDQESQSESTSLSFPVRSNRRVHPRLRVRH